MSTAPTRERHGWRGVDLDVRCGWRARWRREVVLHLALVLGVHVDVVHLASQGHRPVLTKMMRVLWVRLAPAPAMAALAVMVLLCERVGGVVLSINPILLVHVRLRDLGAGHPLAA